MDPWYTELSRSEGTVEGTDTESNRKPDANEKTVPIYHQSMQPDYANLVQTIPYFYEPGFACDRNSTVDVSKRAITDSPTTHRPTGWRWRNHQVHMVIPGYLSIEAFPIIPWYWHRI